MLEVRSLTKSFSAQRVVDEVSFALGDGQVLAVLGPSGSGKSTLLAMIAGLETPDAGDILWKGASLAGVPPERRGFGLIFQDYALFPHKNVAQNVGFGLRAQGKNRTEIESGVRWALRLVGLEGFEKRDVNTLSGGEQQRVALARALAPHPHLLMLDEPLGALDRALRERLLDELRATLRGRGLNQTALYVTHDQEEAFALADHVVVLRSGRVMQTGTPAQVYAHPASRFVAEFLGLTNIVEGELRRNRPGAETVVVTEVGEIPVNAEEFDSLSPAKTGVWVLLRPEGAAVAQDTLFHVAGQVVEKSFRGSRNVVRLQVGQAALTFEFPASQPLPEVGETLRLRLGPDATALLP